MRFLRISVFCLLMIFLGCKEKTSEAPSRKAVSDSAQFYYHTAKRVNEIEEKLYFYDQALSHLSIDDSLILPVLNNKVYYYNRRGKYTEAMQAANSFIAAAENLQDSSALAGAYYRKGTIHRHLQQPQEAFRYFYLSKELNLQIGDTATAARRLVLMANSQLRLGDFSGSQTSATKALSYLPPTDSIYLSAAYNSVAIVYKTLGDYSSAIEEYRNALPYANAQEDSILYYNNMALSHADLGEYITALELLSENMARLEDTTQLFLRLADNFYFLEWQQKRGNQAQQLVKLKNIRKSRDDLPGLIISYSHLTRVFSETDSERAVRYAQRYLETSRKYGKVSSEMSALEALIRLEDPEAAKAYSLDYLELNDSIQKARNRVKNLFAKMKYDEEEKLKKIASLERMSDRQKLETLRQRNQKLIAISGGVIAVLLGLLLFFFFRQRHKKEKIHEVHQTEARISKKVHDELANDIYHVMTQLNQERESGIIESLESVYQRTRNISRENTEIPTGPDFPDALRMMISTYTTQSVRLVIRNFENIFWEEISAESKITIYRVLQELLVNMKKHSNANLVILTFEKEHFKTRVNYRDNGKGVEKNALGKGSGLYNAEKRIKAIEGTFHYTTGTNGFTAEVRIPD